MRSRFFLGVSLLLLVVVLSGCAQKALVDPNLDLSTPDKTLMLLEKAINEKDEKLLDSIIFLPMTKLEKKEFPIYSAAYPVFKDFIFQFENIEIRYDSEMKDYYEKYRFNDYESDERYKLVNYSGILFSEEILPSKALSDEYKKNFQERGSAFPYSHSLCVEGVCQIMLFSFIKTDNGWRLVPRDSMFITDNEKRELLDFRFDDGLVFSIDEGIRILDEPVDNGNGIEYITYDYYGDFDGTVKVIFDGEVVLDGPVIKESEGDMIYYRQDLPISGRAVGVIEFIIKDDDFEIRGYDV